MTHRGKFADPYIDQDRMSLAELVGNGVLRHADLRTVNRMLRKGVCHNAPAGSLAAHPETARGGIFIHRPRIDGLVSGQAEADDETFEIVICEAILIKSDRRIRWTVVDHKAGEHVGLFDRDD